MRTYSWVYEDTVFGDTVLVIRPRRFQMVPKYRVLAKSNGVVTVRNIKMREFVTRYKFLGRV